MKTAMSPTRARRTRRDVSLALDEATYFFRVNYHFASFRSAACDVGAGCTSATVQIEKPVEVTISDGYGGVLAGQGVTAIDDQGNQVAWETTTSAGTATFY